MIKLKLVEVRRISKQLLYVKQKLFEFGNKPGKYLPNLLVPKGEGIRIPGLKNNYGEEINSAKEKVLKYTKYYKVLYQTSDPSEANLKLINFRAIE